MAFSKLLRLYNILLEDDRGWRVHNVLRKKALSCFKDLWEHFPGVNQKTLIIGTQFASLQSGKWVRDWPFANKEKFPPNNGVLLANV
jgi:hypothetical protein